MSEAIKRARAKSDTRVAIVAVLILVLLGAVDGWGSCGAENCKYATTLSNSACQSLLNTCESYLNGSYSCLTKCLTYNAWNKNPCYVTCTDKASADSLICVLNPSAEGCDDGGKAEATARRDSLKRECEEQGGVSYHNIFQSADGKWGNGGGCDECPKKEDGTYKVYSMENLRQMQKEECCVQGQAPEEFKCNYDPVTGYSNTNANRCLATSEVVVKDGEPFVRGCEEDTPQDTTSSGGGGGDTPPDTTSTGDSTGTGEDWEYDYRDSLHKMLQMDTILWGVQKNIAQTLEDIRNKPRDTTIVNVAGDTIIVKPADVHFNPTIQGDTIIVNNDSLAGAIQALAEAMANMRGDSSGVYSDSALMAAIWGDTAGHSLGDTSGWGDSLGWLQGKIDSLGLGAGAYGECDTTGGKTCDEQYIGKDGLATATGKYRGLAKDLRDSVLENGPVHDSVQAWSNLFKSEKLSGGGSNTCPTILTKTWNVDFKLTQVEIGPLGKYVCSPIMGSITPWQVGRTLLRALVAIACMWWLFRQAMGVSGGSSDEED